MNETTQKNGKKLKNSFKIKKIILQHRPPSKHMQTTAWPNDVFKRGGGYVRTCLKSFAQDGPKCIVCRVIFQKKISWVIHRTPLQEWQRLPDFSFLSRVSTAMLARDTDVAILPSITLRYCIETALYFLQHIHCVSKNSTPNSWQ